MRELIFCQSVWVFSGRKGSETLNRRVLSLPIPLYFVAWATSVNLPEKISREVSDSRITLLLCNVQYNYRKNKCVLRYWRARERFFRCLLSKSANYPCFLYSFFGWGVAEGGGGVIRNPQPFFRRNSCHLGSKEGKKVVILTVRPAALRAGSSCS